MIQSHESFNQYLVYGCKQSSLKWYSFIVELHITTFDECQWNRRDTCVEQEVVKTNNKHMRRCLFIFTHFVSIVFINVTLQIRPEKINHFF